MPEHYHLRVYDVAEVPYTPSGKPWICAVCGAEGRDRPTDLNYAAVKAHFAAQGCAVPECRTLPEFYDDTGHYCGYHWGHRIAVDKAADLRAPRVCAVDGCDEPPTWRAAIAQNTVLLVCAGHRADIPAQTHWRLVSKGEPPCS